MVVKLHSKVFGGACHYRMAGELCRGCLDSVDWNGGMEWNGMEWNGIATPINRRGRHMHRKAIWH